MTTSLLRRTRGDESISTRISVLHVDGRPTSSAWRRLACWIETGETGHIARACARWIESRRFPDTRADRRCDLVHCHSALSALPLLSWARSERRHVIVSLTGGDLGRALVSNRWLRTLRRVFIIADALIVDSDYGARLADACGAARTKIRKIADTAHVKIVEPRGPRARPPGPRTGPLRIIAHAPLVERHGIAVAFEAMALCRERGFDIELVVLGSGPLRRALRSYAAHLGLGNRVSFPGNADDEQFIDELHGSDAFLSPVVTAHDGDRETSPTRETLIAMAAAVPIIASRHPSVAELLRDGDNSLLVEERDAEGLAAALQLASTRSMRSLGRKARESIDALPSTESWVAEHLRLYDDIVGGRVNSASRAAHVASAR